MLLHDWHEFGHFQFEYLSLDVLAQGPDTSVVFAQDVSSTVRTVLNCQRQNEGFSLFNGANANGRMRVSASVPKTVRSIVLGTFIF